MTETVKKLRELLKTGKAYLSATSEVELSKKPAPDKWSKKEIIGHLIDSGTNNLQRFTEIQFESKPYKIRSYNQDELVKANDYQNADSAQVIDLWKSLNMQIVHIMESQTEEILDFEIELPNGTYSDLHFLFFYYVDHLEHHLMQIMNP